jgi:hypothetical protein
VNSQNIIRCAFKHWEEGAEGACIYGRIKSVRNAASSEGFGR